MKKLILFISLISLLFLTLNCSQEVTGGGMDVGNPYLSGVILTDTYEGAESTTVYILPSEFNPHTDSISLNDYKALTNKNGSFQFDIENMTNQNYTLWSTVTIDSTQFVSFKTDIQLKDTAKPIYSILQKAVNLAVFIPDSIKSNQIYTYIPGTPFKINFITDSLMGDSILLLSSIPQGLLPRINISEIAIEAPKALTDTLLISSDSIQSTTAFEVWSNYSSKNSVISKDTVYSVFEDSKGNYWFGTFGGGIYRLADNNWTNFTKSDGLNSNVNLCFGEDSAGNIWCGTGKGIAYINGDLITVLDTSLADVPKNGVFEFERDPYNRLWIASGDGVYLFDHGSWDKYDTSNSDLPANLVYSVDWREDSLFIATFGGGLAILSSNGWDTLTTSNSSIPSNYIYTVKVDSDNTIWLGTTEGIVFYKDSKWTTIKDELPHDNVWALAPDNRGGAWVGTQSGIVRYKNGIRNIFTTDNSTFLSTHTFAISAIDDGIMFGTGVGATVVEYDY